MEPTGTIVFVYGTLKRGCSNHRHISAQEFIREAVTAPLYRMIDLGPYPGLVRDRENGLAIYGELYAVTERGLAELDEFEGVAGPFVRATIEVEEQGTVWAYYMNTPVPEGAKTGDRWPL